MYLKRFWVVAFGLIGLRLASSSIANVAWLSLSILALSGRANAIRALGLSWFFTMLSPGIAPEEVALASVGRYLILVAAAVSVFFSDSMGGSRFRLEVSKSVFFTLMVGVFFVVHSIFFSPILDVSVLKSLTWMLAFVTLFSAWNGISEDERSVLEQQIFYALIFLMLVSLPLLRTDIGYLRNGSGFQGILNHPQAFGPTMALVAAWLGSQIFSKMRPPLYMLVLFFVAVALIVLSATRTAGLALLLGLGMALLVGRLIARRRFREYLPGLNSARVRWVLIVAMIGLIGTLPFWNDSLSEYIAKGTNNKGVANVYEQSRGDLIDRMLININKYPLRGIGFGIASDPSIMVVERDSVLGLPSGAPVEKGVAYLAVWEEVGLFGFLLVLAWLWMVVRRAARFGGIAALAVCLTALFMNFGESTLFSPGGMGMLSLILIAWAASAKPAQKKTAHA